STFLLFQHVHKMKKERVVPVPSQHLQTPVVSSCSTDGDAGNAAVRGMHSVVQNQTRGPEKSTQKSVTAAQYNKNNQQETQNIELYVTTKNGTAWIHTKIVSRRYYQNRVCSAMMILGGVQNRTYHSIMHLCQQRQNGPFVRVLPPPHALQPILSHGVCLLRPPPLLGDDNKPRG
ncbi:unnamed protein product, partial [Ectocarpus sp. 12 AP-2014]